MAEQSGKLEIEISLMSILKVVGLFVALYVAYLIREVFAIFFVSLILSALIDPFADWCEKRNVARAVAVLVTYVGLIGVLAAIIVGIIPPITNEFGQLVANSGDFVRSIFERYGFLRVMLERLGGGELIGTGLSTLQGGGEGGGIFGTIQGVVGGVTAFVLVLALTFYMVVEEAALRKFFLSVTPHKYHEYWISILPRVQDKLGMWLRGQLMLALSIAVMVFIGLNILSIKYALVLALLAGFAEFVPYVGPIASAVPAVILAFAQSPFLGFATIAMYIVIQWCENHILVPKIMQKAIGINPIVSIIAILVGVKLGGFVGVILAIPIAAAALVFTQDFFAREEPKQHSHIV